MAEITLNVPTPQIARVVNALCAIGGYNGDPTDQAARREFAKNVLAQDLQQKVLRYEQQQAAAAAMAAVTVGPITVD